MRGGAQDGVAEAARVALADVVHGGEVAGLLDAGETGLVALAAERLLQLVVAVEVVLQGTLVASGDHEDVGEPGRHGLLDDVLDGRLVDDRKHFLRRGLGGGEEACPEAGGGDDRFADPGVRLSHAAHHNRCVPEIC
ncbi:hypothetical protein SFR_2690 [Streptomyces sp. FR-008]|nr:hypothetical protein SFR_2690 [Streptomyces sp. FR-008]